MGHDKNCHGIPGASHFCHSIPGGHDNFCHGIPWGMTSFVMGQLLSMWRDRLVLAHAGPGSDGVVFAPPQDLGMVKQAPAQRQVSATGRHGDPFLAGYKLGSRLGMGTFGVVRLGFRKDSGASCAIKMVNVDAQDATCRFRREAHLLTQLAP